MYAPPLNPKEAQDIAKRSGNDTLMFWTSVATLGFMGVMATTATAKMIFDMTRRGEHGRLDIPQQHQGRGRARGR